MNAREEFTPEDLDADRRDTLERRERIFRNANLLYWFNRLYDRALFARKEGPILEIGSGASPLKILRPEVVASDILDMEHLDHVFDAHDIDAYDSIADESLEIITMTNVLHHLHDPIEVMNKAARKLRPGGRLVIVEPYFSTLSSFIFRYIHHEKTDFSIEKPKNRIIGGPLETANICLPFLIFFKRSDWLSQLRDNYTVEKIQFSYFSSLSYPATGGISRKFPIPHFIYRKLFHLDDWLARRFPSALAFQFIASIPTRG